MMVWYKMKRYCGHIIIIIINILSYRDKLRNIMSIDTKKLAKIWLASFLLHKESWNYAADTRNISDTLHLFFFYIDPFENINYTTLTRVLSLFFSFHFFSLAIMKHVSPIEHSLVLAT